MNRPGPPFRDKCRRGHKMEGDNILWRMNKGRRIRRCRACVEMFNESQRTGKQMHKVYHRPIQDRMEESPHGSGPIEFAWGYKKGAGKPLVTLEGCR